MPLSCLALRRPGRLLATWLMVTGAAIALGEIPATAEIISVGYDLEALPSLDEGEQERLDILQRTQQPILLSEVSPNGEYLMIATTDRISQSEWWVQLLNLRTGELEESLALEYEVFNPTLPIQWVDNTTVRFVQESYFGPWEIVSINRVTGIVSHTTVYPTEEESGEILGAAPDLSRFALQVYGEEEDTIYLVSLGSLGRIEVAKIPTGRSINAPSWSRSGQQVALVTFSAEEHALYDRTPFSPNLAHPVSQDALGRTPPADNPFLAQSELKVYDFTQAEPLQLDLKATEQNGHTMTAAHLRLCKRCYHECNGCW